MTRFLVVTPVLAALTATGTHVQTSAGSNRVLSPTTVPYWQQRENRDGTGPFVLPVLWRGSPGWANVKRNDPVALLVHQRMPPIECNRVQSHRCFDGFSCAPKRSELLPCGRIHVS
jgi:hypothetical protein